MSQVLVTFKVESDDPDDRIGISEERFLEIEDAIAALGGEDTDYVKEA